MERLIKNVVIPFAETALLLILQQQACDLHTLTGGISFGKVWMVWWAARSACILEQEAPMGELGVSGQHVVSPWLLLHSHWALSSPGGRVISKFTSIQISSVTVSPRENSNTT